MAAEGVSYPRKRFNGKVAFVTGVSSGIGLATVKLFLNEGASVYGVDKADLPGDLLSRLNEVGVFQFKQTDLTVSGAATALVSECNREFKRIDILVNAAGIMDGCASADNFTDDEWNRVMAINVDVPLRLMRECLRLMKGQKSGVIVNVGSKASVSGAISGVAYTASKHALAGITKNVAWRFRDEGIRCNAVLPGGVATNITASLVPECFDQPGFDAMKPVLDTHVENPDFLGENKIPIGPEDVASAILFLAADEAKMINGAFLPVDRSWSTI